MRVAINGMFWPQPAVGSGQYLHGLLAMLPQIAPEHTYVVLRPAYARSGPPLPAGMEQRLLRTPFDGRSKNRAKLWFEQVAVPLAVTQLRADLLHVPYFAPPLCVSVPTIVTILDIIPLLLPEYRRARSVRAYMRLVALAARRANHVIAISEHSRADIITHLGCAPARVTTVPLAADPRYRPLDRAQAREYVAQHYRLDRPFIYYVGGLDARKNLPTLIHAFGRLRRSGGPEATLAIAGRALGTDPALFPDIDALIEREGIGPSVHRLVVPHADNPLLYAAAQAFAYPSRYEGFGLPPLEALASGTPTVVAAASSLPEVVGDAALLVAPDDISGWTAALWRLLADNTLRTELRQRGLIQAARFSYARVARETATLYRLLI